MYKDMMEEEELVQVNRMKLTCLNNYEESFHTFF